MAAHSDSDSDSYVSFSSEDGTPCPPFILKDMIVDDNFRYNRNTTMTFFVSNNQKKEHEEKLDLEIPESEEQSKLVPDAMITYIRLEYPVILEKLSTVDYLQSGCFMYFGRSLVSTLNVENPRIRLPNDVICDICLFTRDKPVLVLTILQDNVEEADACEQYNTYLARGINVGLREIMADISVVSGIMKINSDFREELNRIYDTEKYLPTTYVKMNLFKSKLALGRFLDCIATVKTSTSMSYSDPTPSRCLSRKEFNIIVNHIDCVEHADIPDGVSQLFMLEFACRIARRGRTQLRLPPHLDTIDVENLRNYIPLLECAENISDKYKHIIDVKDNSDGTFEWTISCHTPKERSKIIYVESVIRDWVIETLEREDNTFITIDWSTVQLEMENIKFAPPQTKILHQKLIRSTSINNVGDDFSMNKFERQVENSVKTTITRGILWNGETGIKLPVPKPMRTDFDTEIEIKDDVPVFLSFSKKMMEENELDKNNNQSNVRKVKEVFAKREESVYVFQADVKVSGLVRIKEGDVKDLARDKIEDLLRKEDLLKKEKDLEEMLSFSEGCIKWSVGGFMVFRTWLVPEDTTRAEQLS